MIAIGRNVTGLALGLLGIGAFVFLAIGLVFLKLSPIVIGALIAGGAVVVVSAFRPYLGIHVMLGLLYFEGAIKVTEDVTFTKVLGGLIAAGWLANNLIQRRARDVLNPQTVLVCVYLAWCAISAAHAFDPDAAMTQVVTYVLLALSMMMIGSVLDTPQRLRNFIFAIACWTIFTSVIALGMYYAGMTPYAVGWSNRNLLAMYINVGAIAALLLYPLMQGLLARLVVMIGVPVLLLTLALTLSRTGLIVMAVTILSVWYRLARERGFLVLFGTALACVALVFLLPGQFWERANTILPAIERQEDTFGMRVRVWQTGLRLIEDHPFLGVGPANFVQVSTRYNPVGVLGRHLNSHNTYVGTAAETGLIGMALFLVVVIGATVSVRRAVHAARLAGRDDLALMGVNAETMILAIMLTSITMDTQGHKILWIGLGICVGFVAIVRTSLAHASPSVVPAAGEAVPEAATT
jgi:O-antigen ligase